MLKIERKIVGYDLVHDAPGGDSGDEEQQTSFVPPPPPAETARAGAGRPARPDPEELELMSENIEALSAGTTHEIRRPFEIFINSKNMEHFEWIVALTRLASAVFRKGGNLEFMVEELKSVYAPQGGYWKPGTGVYMNSVVAEIGWIIERHMTKLSLIAPTEPDPHQQKFIDEKRRQASNSYNDRLSSSMRSTRRCRRCCTW